MILSKEYCGRLWLLFWTFAKIAALVVGGGLAMLPVIEETFVNRKNSTLVSAPRQTGIR